MKNPNKGIRLKDGTVVVNEKCTCGALRTEHGGFFGHGPGPDGCVKFTWKGFIVRGKTGITKDKR